METGTTQVKGTEFYLNTEKVNEFWRFSFDLTLKTAPLNRFVPDGRNFLVPTYAKYGVNLTLSLKIRQQDRDKFIENSSNYQINQLIFENKNKS